MISIRHATLPEGPCFHTLLLSLYAGLLLPPLAPA